MSLINRIGTSTLLVAAMGLLLASGGCVTAKQKMLDAGIQPLNDQELKTLYSTPQNAIWQGKQKGKIELQYSPNGEQKITFPGGEDHGTYRIANGEFCNKWTVIKKGAESCNSLFKVENKSYDFINKDGSKSGTLTFQ